MSPRGGCRGEHQSGTGPAGQAEGAEKDAGAVGSSGRLGQGQRRPIRCSCVCIMTEKVALTEKRGIPFGGHLAKQEVGTGSPT